MSKATNMSKASNRWLTPKEIEAALGAKKSKQVLEDLIYSRRTRREVLDKLMEAVECNEYSAEDFLREIVKTPGAK